MRRTDWDYAWAHLLPFVGLYDAVTRRTITPFAATLFLVKMVMTVLD